MTTGDRFLPFVLVLIAGIYPTSIAEACPATTSGAIAIENLDYQLTQPQDPVHRIELLLAISRFQNDYDALDQAVTLAQALPVHRDNLMVRSRVRAAAHQFDAALADLNDATRLGAEESRIASQKALILVATGRATQALGQLESDVKLRPSYASHSALAGAYSETGRYRDAERQYYLALASMETTSPLPYAWAHFALGVMWSEQAGDRQRGEMEYKQALAYLPQFAAANIHQAEIEFERGDLQSAEDRLLPIVRRTPEPEALALLGEIQRHTGGEALAKHSIEMAEKRYQYLLQRQPLAFVDHAAEFYLSGGADAERANVLAMRNLANRPTLRAFATALRAAVASRKDACDLIRRMRSAFSAEDAPYVARTEWSKAVAKAGLQCPEKI